LSEPADQPGHDGLAGPDRSSISARRRDFGIAEHTQLREPFEQALREAVRASSDFVEGVAAFRERCQPNYE